MADPLSPAAAITAGSALGTWDLGPVTVILAALALALYLRGAWALRASPRAPGPVSHCLYTLGVAVAFLAVASPVAPLSQHNFFDLEIQNLMLRMLAPMLIVLSAPLTVLVAGTPAWLRRTVISPLASNDVLRAAFAVAFHPVVATGFFIGVLYVWHLPVLTTAILHSSHVADVMLVTLAAAGLLFFGRVLDSRPAPEGLRYGPRLFMAVLVMMAQILIGAFLAFKETVIYPVFDQIGRFGAESPLYDESLGGIVVWIPSICLMTLALLVIVRHWGRAGDDHDFGPGAEVALTSAALRDQVAAKNKALAASFIVMVLGFFAVTMSIGIASVMMGG